MTNQAMVGLNQLCCSIVIEKRTQKAEIYDKYGIKLAMNLRAQGRKGIIRQIRVELAAMFSMYLG